MSRNISQIFRWLRWCLAWLVRARLAIFVGLVVAAALYVPLCLIQTEQSLRIAGLGLQLLGLAAAALGIRDTRRMFGRPSLLESVRRWFHSFPRFRPEAVTGSAEAKVLISATAAGYGWKRAGPSPTLESRMEAIEANLQGLRERFDKAEASLNHGIRALQQELNDERATREQGDSQLHTEIEVASADGLHLAAAGVVWLAFGIVISTIPVEILGVIR